MIPKVITTELFDREVRINLGELLFPGIVLTTAVIYFFETRRLPDRSLIYADPLLYVAAGLAVITIVQHAITAVPHPEPMADGVVEINKPVSEPNSEQPETREQSVIDENSPSSDSKFGWQSATLYTGMTLVYIICITVFARDLTSVSFVGLTSIFLGALLALFGERRVSRIVVYSVGFALLVWGVFINWLKVPVL
jgi:hypothetical protein